MTNRKPKTSDTYWTDVLAHRMPEGYEVERLETVLYGFFARQDEYDNIRDFHQYAKRPYGNKNVAASIAFNLGWDWERRLCTEPVPEEVERQAKRLHQLVGEQLQEE